MTDCCCCGFTTCLGVFGGLVLLVKIYNYLTTGVFKGKQRLDGKTTIVTGSNSGIGLVTAKDFARRGARVIMVCRDMNKAKMVKEEITSETGNNNITIKHVDFLSLESVRKCANEILSEEARIDILVNNAGSGGLGFGPTVDGLEKLMQSNYYGPFLFTNILLGKIKESVPSRIVNVSSLAYRFGKIDFDNFKKSDRTSEPILYSDTKLANIYFSNELAHKLRGTGVTSNCLHPGVFPSAIARNANTIFIMIWKLIIKLFYKTIEEGAQTSIYLSVSPDVANVSGKYFADCKMVELKDLAKDNGISKKLWEMTENHINLKQTERHY